MVISRNQKQLTDTGPEPLAQIHQLPFVGDEEAFLKALKAGHQGAFSAMYDQYADHIQRVLVRIMGFDTEIGDLLQEVFVQALGGIGSVRDAQRLKAWLTSIAVFTAKGCIRRRTRHRWLMFKPTESLPVQSVPAADNESREVLALTYELLERLPADQRIAFVLRFFEGMELSEVADACQVSLATIKRKLARAEHRFLILAKKQPLLTEWIESSARWRDR